jgi:hypothetical protein
MEENNDKGLGTQIEESVKIAERLKYDKETAEKRYLYILDK